MRHESEELSKHSGSAVSDHAQGTPAHKHMLLTVLGTNKSLVRYVLEDREAESQLAPIALLDLLPQAERPDRVAALCTPEAKHETWPLLESALRGKCHLERIDVAGGTTHEDIDSYLVQVSQSIANSGIIDLTVDVTHGFRHFSFLTYIGVLYLAALSDIRVRGAYYGLLLHDVPSPFLDLRPLLELPRWIHALQVVKETGSTLPLANALESGLQERSSRPAKDIARDLSRMSESYLSGLPIELGRLTYDIRTQRLRALKKLLVHRHRLPLADELINRLEEILKPFAAAVPASGDGWKSHVRLTEEELGRQARIIDDLLSRKNVATALGLMNEWTVSWVALRDGHARDWLDFPNVRRRAGHLLGALAAVSDDDELVTHLTPKQCLLASFWRNLSSLRNAYHHHGMRPQPLVADRKAEKSLREIEDFWSGTLRFQPDISLEFRGSQPARVLVSPIGKRPGVLFSAIYASRAAWDGAEPTLCLLVCSDETERTAGEALLRAGYSGAAESLVLRSAFRGGRDEIKRQVRVARPHMIGAESVLVNVTGGTTYMGLVAEALATAARDLACPVRRFGLIDTRSPSEQTVDPYRTGEPFWLDTAEDVDDANAN